MTNTRSPSPVIKPSAPFHLDSLLKIFSKHPVGIIRRIDTTTILILTVLAIYLSPWLIFGQTSFFTIHDFLDGEVPMRVALARSGQLFAPQATLVDSVAGLPRSVLPSQFSFLTWIYVWFSPLRATILNLVLVHVVAFFSMRTFLRRHVIPDADSSQVADWASLCFALLPFFPPVGLTVAGQPLMFSAFLNVLKGRGTWKDFLVAVLMPFYSCLFVGMFFVLLVGAILGIYDVMVNRKVNWRFFALLAVCAAVFVFVEYRLFDLMLLSPTFASHRASFVASRLDFGVGISTFYSALRENLFNGHYHAPSIQNPVMLVSTVAAAGAAWDNVLCRRRYVFLTAAILGGAILFAMQSAHYLQPLVDVFKPLAGFNMSRFHWLHPVLWVSVFALVLSAARKAWGAFGRNIAAAALFVQILVSFEAHPILSEWHGARLSFREFYAEELFADVRQFIGQPQTSYKVVGLALHPGVLMYNGFRGIDVYTDVYAEPDKVAFRKIIAKELEKSSDLTDYFDGWGSRRYIFSAELGLAHFEDYGHAPPVSNLSLDIPALKDQKITYLLSAAELKNPQQAGFSLLSAFKRPDLPLKIWLYRVD